MHVGLDDELPIGLVEGPAEEEFDEGSVERVSVDLPDKSRAGLLMLHVGR